MVEGSGQNWAVRVLLAEDNCDDEFLTIWALKHAGLEEIAVVHDGSEALARLNGPEPLPDLLILDLCLPKIDGREVLRRVRENSRTRGVPIVILTSSEDSGDKEICGRLGIIGFISKPLTADMVKELLSRLGKG